MHAGNFFKDLVGDIDDYYALKNKMDNGGELTDEEKSAMGRYRAHIAGATNVLQTIDSDLAAEGSDRASVLKSHGIDENQLSILRQIV
jgi:hypothetical protein